MPDLHRSRSRPPLLLAAAILGILAFGLTFLGASVQAAPPAPSGTFTAATSSPPPPTPQPSPSLGVPKSSSQTAPRMWAVNLAGMVVYENGSGYLYGFWRQFGEAVEKPARLYWGRPSATAPGGCPDVSDRVYHVLQTGFAQQQDFFLIVDRDPDPRQPGAYCVRGVELENRITAPQPVPGGPAPAPQRPPATTPPVVK